MLDVFEYMREKARDRNDSYTFTIDGKETRPFQLNVEKGSYADTYFKNGSERIDIDKVTFIPHELNSERPYLINQDAIERLKEENLVEVIKVELESMATAVSYFYDHYKEDDVELTVYRLANYNTASSSNTPMTVLVRFEHKGDPLKSIKEHTLTGLTSHSLYSGQVSKETVAAWRYKKMDWRDVRELSPTFVETVLKGNKP